MKIGIDMDEVIAGFVPKFIDFYNNKFNKNFKYENWTSYNFWEVVGGTKEELVGLVDEFYNSAEFDKIDLISGSRKAIKSLSKQNEILIVTSRPIRFKPKTNEFLRKYFSDIFLPVLYSDDFHKQHSLGKAGICKREGINIFVEDNLEYALSCSKEGVKTFLLDRPWNQGYTNGVIRVRDWNEILNKINWRDSEK